MGRHSPLFGLSRKNCLSCREQVVVVVVVVVGGFVVVVVRLT
jgi:hypothetical protein